VCKKCYTKGECNKCKCAWCSKVLSIVLNTSSFRVRSEFCHWKTCSQTCNDMILKFHEQSRCRMHCCRCGNYKVGSQECLKCSRRWCDMCETNRNKPNLYCCAHCLRLDYSTFRHDE